MTMRPLACLLSTCAFIGALTCICVDASAGETQGKQAIHRLVAKKGELPAFFDCLRETEAVIVSAHRGGPSAGFPENAIETFDNTLSRIPALLEVDVQKSADGVLMLMHDDDLDRTSTGTGPLAEKTFKELRKLKLKDNAGAETPFLIPTLDEVLKWSKGKTIVALDRKDPITYGDLIAKVKAHDAFDRVIFATYKIEDAIEISNAAPQAVIVTPVEKLEDLDALQAGGVPLDRVLAWEGIEIPQPDLFKALAERGVEVIFGTLGWWSGSWDERIRVLGDDTLYIRITRGVQIVPTDRPVDVMAVLPGADRAESCSAR